MPDYLLGIALHAGEEAVCCTVADPCRPALPSDTLAGYLCRIEADTPEEAVAVYRRACPRDLPEEVCCAA